MIQNNIREAGNNGHYKTKYNSASTPMTPIAFYDNPFKEHVGNEPPVNPFTAFSKKANELTNKIIKKESIKV